MLTSRIHAQHNRLCFASAFVKQLYRKTKPCRFVGISGCPVMLFTYTITTRPFVNLIRFML